MSARDDFPPIPNGVNRPGGRGLQHLQMCDEIDRLRIALTDLTDEYERLIDRCPPDVAVLHLPLIRAHDALRRRAT